MENTEPRHVEKARKSHLCDWCGERIEAGNAYSTWFCFDEQTTTRVHPECYEAMGKADLHDEELPPRGTFGRGCWTEDKDEPEAYIDERGCIVIVGEENYRKIGFVGRGRAIPSQWIPLRRDHANVQISGGITSAESDC